MKMARRLGFGVSSAALLLTFAVPASAAAPAAKPEAKKATVQPITTGPQPLCSKVTPSCGTDCTNMPFELTKCWTTPYGPAKADVVVVPAGVQPAVATKSPNMLSCQGGGAYALCFFSGPPAGIFGGQALPCTLREDGLTADCTCQYYSSGTYYVDINGILNQGAYYQAVQQCGADGCGCPNITGSTCQSGTAPPPSQAAVCDYINNQPTSSFYPQIQVISTFSFAMSPPNGSYKLATAAATCHGKYAGCMTAACKFADGSAPSSHKDGDAVQCECPVYDGDYQVERTAKPARSPARMGRRTSGPPRTR